jgi:hypothetical protein
MGETSGRLEASSFNPPIALDILERLIGAWELEGQMGEMPLQQSVVARWTLGGRFVEVRCQSTLPAEPGETLYEAVYHIGYNAERDRYVLHLLDSTSVPLTCTVGVGQRRGNVIPFAFTYPRSPFIYEFTWHPDVGEWSFVQTYLEDGQTKTFATKRMRRIDRQD